MAANDIQFGGDHYKGSDYQHWDYATDLRLPYLVGVASKYFSRWRQKGGVEDLQKGIHYIQKCVETSVSLLPVNDRSKLFWRFVLSNHISMTDAMIIWYIHEGEWDTALQAAETLLAAEQGADV